MNSTIKRLEHELEQTELKIEFRKKEYARIKQKAEEQLQILWKLQEEKREINEILRIFPTTV